MWSREGNIARQCSRNFEGRPRNSRSTSVALARFHLRACSSATRMDLCVWSLHCRERSSSRQASEVLCYYIRVLCAVCAVPTKSSNATPCCRSMGGANRLVKKAVVQTGLCPFAWERPLCRYLILCSLSSYLPLCHSQLRRQPGFCFPYQR